MLHTVGESHSCAKNAQEWGTLGLGSFEESRGKIKGKIKRKIKIKGSGRGRPLYTGGICEITF